MAAKHFFSDEMIYRSRFGRLASRLMLAIVVSSPLPPAVAALSQAASGQERQGAGMAGSGLRLEPVPATFRTTFESWKISDDERMGMLGLNMLFDVHPNIKLGVGSYGARTGDRGGFITLGLASEFHFPIDDSWVLRSGLFVGAGGGAGAGAGAVAYG